MLTPSLPLSRSPDLAVCLTRFPAARLWLKDESLEDSAIKSEISGQMSAVISEPPASGRNRD